MTFRVHDRVVFKDDLSNAWSVTQAETARVGDNDVEIVSISSGNTYRRENAKHLRHAPKVGDKVAFKKMLADCDWEGEWEIAEIASGAGRPYASLRQKTSHVSGALDILAFVEDATPLTVAEVPPGFPSAGKWAVYETEQPEDGVVAVFDSKREAIDGALEMAPASYEAVYIARIRTRYAEDNTHTLVALTAMASAARLSQPPAIILLAQMIADAKNLKGPITHMVTSVLCEWAALTLPRPEPRPQDVAPRVLHAMTDEQLRSFPQNSLRGIEPRAIADYILQLRRELADALSKAEKAEARLKSIASALG